MNWMWGMPETVGVVIDTFQTMLNLLEEYPDFIFSQSQASTYEIIEKYAPSMLPEIRKRVQELSLIHISRAATGRKPNTKIFCRR